MLSSFNTVLFDLPPICVLPTMKFCFIMDAETRGHKTMDLSEAQSVSFSSWDGCSTLLVPTTQISNFPSARVSFFSLYIYTKGTNALLLIYMLNYILFIYIYSGKNYFSILWKLLTYIKNEFLNKDCLHESSNHFVYKGSTLEIWAKYSKRESII